MKKHFLWVVMALLVTTFALAGCKGKDFDSVPYNASTIEAQELETVYNEAKAGTYQLTANYETTITNVYPMQNITETITIKTTVGDLNNNYFCRTESVSYKNDQPAGSETVILYNGCKYTLTYDVEAQTTTKIKTVYNGLYPKQETLDNLYAKISQDDIETIYEKTYEKEQYYRLSLLLRNVNADTGIAKPTDPENREKYYTSYNYEFGVSKSGYLKVFNIYNTLIVGEYQGTSDWKVYRTQTKKTTLKQYGANLYIEVPDDLDSYVEG